MKKLILLLALFGILYGQEVPKKIVIEHFTNSRCSICASKNPAFYNTINDYAEVIHVAYHPSSPYPNCIFSQYNSLGNDSRTNYYGIYGGTPRVVINGSVVGVSTPMISDSRIQSEQNLTSPFRINITQTTILDDSLEVTVEIATVAASSVSSANMFIVVSEELVNFNAPNGENQHHDVFRTTLGGVNGQIVTLPAVGMTATYSFKVVIDQDWSIPQLTTTVMLQNESTKEILQAEQSEKIGGTVNIEAVVDLDHAFFPNPAKDVLHIANTQNIFEKVEIYNIIGSLIKTENVANIKNSSINLQDVESGSYIIRFYGSDQKIYTRKLMVKR